MSIILKISNVHDPISLEIGDDWIILVQCTNSDGSPMDLTGAGIEWKLVDPTTGTVLYTLTVGSGISVVTPNTLGQCVVWLTKVQSGTLVAKEYNDQVRVTTAAGLRSTQSRGRITAIAVY